MEIRLTHQNNFQQLSKQVDIIKEYILLKFGLDFQEFYNTRYNGPKLSKTPSASYSQSNKRNNSKRKRRELNRCQNPPDNLTDEEDNSVTCYPEIPDHEDDDSDVELIVKQRIKTELPDNEIPDDLMEFSLGQEQDDPDCTSFSEQIIPDASSDDDNEGPTVSKSPKKKRKSPKSRKSVKASTSTVSHETVEIPVDNNAILTVGETKQGKPLIIHNGFCFRFHKFGKDGRRMWMCENQRKGKCTARLHTSNDIENPKLISENGSHNHNPDEISNELKLINTAIRRDATNSTLESAEIVSKNLQQISPAVQKALPKIVSIKQKIKKIRKRLAANENTPSASE